MAGSSPSERVAALAESFVERYRRGERPSLREYTDKHPDLAADIREVFPAVAMMENVALDRDAPDGGPVPAAPPPVAQVGDFRIVREVGRGGMGVVYEAEQVSLGRFVALKLLPGHTAATDRQKERFLREARAAAKLHHTNIVPVFGFGEADGVPYYAMQFICGQGVDAVIAELRARTTGSAAPGPAAELARSLVSGEFRPADATVPAAPSGTATVAPAPRAALSEEATARPGRGPLWRGIARLGQQVANALDHAHGLGVLHRDVKPSNLLLDLHGTAWVTDFGLAKAEGQPDLTHDGDVLGTLRYLPPEALDGKADARGDVFALGLCLYELLALRPAYDAPDRSGLVRQVTAADPPPLRALVPGLPRDLATVVHKALQREPDRRYRSAAALADDLGWWLDGRPIAARPVSRVEHVWRACKRNPWASGMAAAALLALVLGAAGALWGREVAVANERDANDHRDRAERNERAAVAAADDLRRERDEVARLNAQAADRLYSADMNRAQLNWYGGSVSLVRDLLAAHRPAPGGPDRRGFEWYYLNRLVNAGDRVIPCRNRRMPVLCVTPKGDTIASAGGDGVEVWAADGKPLWARPAPEYMSYNYAAAFSPAGDLLAYTENAPGGATAVLRVLRAADGREERALAVRGELIAVAFAPAGGTVAALLGNGTVRVWDTATWKDRLAFRAHTGKGDTAAFSTDGRFFVTAGVSDRNELRVWDAREWEGRAWNTGEVKLHPVRVCRADVGPADCLSVRAGATQVVGCNRLEVRAWDLRGDLSWPGWGKNYGALRAVYNPAGDRVIVACNDSVIRVLDAESGEVVDTIHGHENAVEAVALPADGAWLASAGRDRTVRTWPLPAPAAARVIGGDTTFASAAVSRDGAVLVTAEGGAGLGGVRAWDARTGRPLADLGQHALGANRVRFSPDGRWLVSCGRDGIIRCWAAADAGRGGGPRWESPAHTGWHGVTDIDFEPGGDRFVSSVWDTTLRVWDAASGKELLKTHAPKLANWATAFRPGGRHVATACDLNKIDRHNSVIVYDAATGHQAFRLDDPGVSHGAPRYSPDGKVLYTASDLATVRAWDAETGRPRPEVFKGHTGLIESIAVSPDGRRLLTASDDGTARVWDAATGHELLVLRGHTGVVRDAVFAPAGDAVVTAGEDGTVRIWDAPRK